MALVGADSYRELDDAYGYYRLCLYTYGYSRKFHWVGKYYSYFMEYTISFEKKDKLLNKAKEFIKHNKINSQKQFFALETLFKLQVLS